MFKNFAWNLARIVAFVFIKTFYRLKLTNLNIPASGRAVLVSNHVTYLDAFIIALVSKRPVRFIMYYKIYNIPFLRQIFKWLRVIPIAGVREDKRILKEAFSEIKKALEADEIVFIFPEGELSRTGNMTGFKAGVERIIKDTPSPVHTMALKGLWGSVFSRSKEQKTLGFRSEIEVIGGSIYQPSEVNRDVLHKDVSRLLVSG